MIEFHESHPVRRIASWKIALRRSYPLVMIKLIVGRLFSMISTMISNQKRGSAKQAGPEPSTAKKARRQARLFALNWDAFPAESVPIHDFAAEFLNRRLTGFGARRGGSAYIPISPSGFFRSMLGRSSSDSMPKCCRNESVVRYSVGRPSVSRCPQGSMKPLSSSDCTE